MKRKKKKNYKKQKKINHFLKFLKEYAAVITICVTIFSAILSRIFVYFEKASSTEFYFQYITIQMNSEEGIQAIQKENSIAYLASELNSPTIHNELNKFLYEYPTKTKGYFITYIVLKQRGETDGENVKINFIQYGSEDFQKKKELSDFPIDEKRSKTITKEIEYSFPKGEMVKVPISICQGKDDYITNRQECYYLLYEPISIEYKNKYFFSKRKVPVRKYLEHDVIIDGDLITGKGGPFVEVEKQWYVK